MKFSERTKIEISEEVLDEIRYQALLSYPNEMCGFLYADRFEQVGNVSDKPGKSFLISAVDRVKNLDALAILHTHIAEPYQDWDARTPSVADVEGQKESGIPWLIFACDGDDITPCPVQLPRYPDPNYLNRNFVTGWTDCYSIVQDYYHFELGICLKDHITYSLRDLVTGKTTFDNFIVQYGFSEVPLESIRNGDLVLLNNGSGRRNHLGIFHNGQVLHQDELSKYENFEHFIGRINAVLRHENCNH